MRLRPAGAGRRTESSSAFTESLERVEHRVEALRQARQLVLAGSVDAPAQILRSRDVLGRLRAGASTARAPRRPPCVRAAPPARSPPTATSARISAQAAEQRVHFRERLRELHRTARCRTAPRSTRNWRSVHLHVAELRPAAVRRERARGRVHRQRHVGRARRDPARGVRHLQVAAHLVGSRRELAEDRSLAGRVRAGARDSTRRSDPPGAAAAPRRVAARASPSGWASCECCQVRRRLRAAPCAAAGPPGCAAGLR